MHLIVLHDTAGSGNPLGISGNYERIAFAPYFIFKDLITIFAFIFVLSLFLFFMPNVLGDSENYVVANPMQTPAAIVPEWYLLPFYAILRSIPNKLLGVIAMFSAILILLLLPITDVSRSRGMQFRPLSKWAFFVFVANFLILMQLGAKHVESPFIEFGQISTVLYFLYFTVVMYGVTLVENTFVDLHILEDKYVPVWHNPIKTYQSHGVLLQSGLDPALEILEAIVTNIPSGSDVYDMFRNAADVPGAIADWAKSQIQQIDTATEAVNTANTADETRDAVETARNSADALAESGKQEVEEARKLAEDYYEDDQPE